MGNCVLIVWLCLASLLSPKVFVSGIVINGTDGTITFFENTLDTHPGWILQLENPTGTGVNYTLEAADADPVTWKKFMIIKTSLSESQLKQNHSFDYQNDSDETGQFKIVATENGVTFKKNILMTLKDTNEHTPQFTNLPSSINVSEATGIGAKLFTITGHDSDSRSEFHQIVYTIESGNQDGYFKLKYVTDKAFDVVVNSTLDYDVGAYVYNLTINASDYRASVNRNPLWNISYLVITLTDVDDLGAAFTDSVFGPVNIPENLSPGDFVTQVTAYDKDRTLKGAISYGLVNESNRDGVFTIDAVSGNISLVKTLNRRIHSSYALLVSATTTYHDAVYAQVLIMIQDSNTHRPNFTSPTFSGNVQENAELGTLVLVVQATDEDEGDNAVVSYSLEGVDNYLFYVTSVNSIGYIYLNGSLDYDVKNLYNFTVIATEALTSEKYNDTAFVILNITEILTNENNPVFNKSSYSVNVTEEQSPGQIIQVIATDSDKAHFGEITYSIVDGSYGMFSIDILTGWINTTASLNRENRDSYVLVTRASDGDSVSQRNSDVLVVVTVLDINDNSPMFLESTYSGLVVENSNIGNMILAVQARDSDEGSNAVFDFSLVGADGKFSVATEGDTGYILVNGSLDYESVKTYTFEVIATESSTPESNSAQANVTITLIDVNDNSPIFSSVSGYSGDVAENSANGTLVLTVDATDEDSGSFGQITYSLVTQGWPFTINSSTGEVRVQGHLDRETEDSYSVTVKAQDGGQPSLSSYTTVFINITDVNDNRPQFSQNTYTANIDEELDVGSSILTVLATDADQAPNNVLSYSIQDTSGLFEVDENGVIRVNGTLDYETNTTYTFVVDAQESSTSESWKTSCTVTINLNDVNEFDPVFSQVSYYAMIAENQPGGSNVLTVQATDQDGQFNIISYGIVSGNEHNNFTIDPSTGVISTTGPIDRETIDRFILKLQASDNGRPNRTTESFAVIDIFDTNDNSPMFAKSLYTTTIPESLPVGTTVLAVKATDVDVNSTNSAIRYFIIGSDSKFDVTSSGLIYVNETLNFEDKTNYSFTIFAEETSTTAKLQHNASVVITITDVNEFDPVFASASYHGNFSEDSVIGTSGIQVEARDDDGEYNAVSYYIVHGDDGIFSINESSGVISTLALLDYETKDQYTLTVQARDNAIPFRTSEVTVVIDVLDVNDNAPYFEQSTYSATVFENVQIGTTVLTIKAQDKDMGENAQFQYYLVGADNAFDVTSDGVIVTTATLNYESQTSYTFKVFANETNSQDSSHEANATVTITVLDVNEFNPVFTSEQYAANVSEDSVVGSSVVQVAATDQDGSYKEISYSLVSGNAAGLFEIGVSSGLITTNGSLDRESEEQYVLTVRAEDNGTSPARTAETVVIVNVVDVSDHKPIFFYDQYNASVVENVKRDTIVLTVKATDNDIGINSKISYGIVGGDGKFRITADGNIVVNGSLDFETKQLYQFQAIAWESEAATNYNDTTSIRIEVQDVNEHNPVFGAPSYTAMVEDTASAGTQVLQVTATDDDGSNNQITYNIFHGDTAGLFQINATTGWISVTNAFNGQTTKQHILTIRATDNDAIHPRTAEVLAIININETVKNASFLLEHVYNVTILENTLVGSTVLTLNVRDAFDGTISVFSYEIVDGNGDFSVTTDGEIQVSKTLDFETMAMYNFTVIVTETEPARGLTANATVTINVKDVNEFDPKFLKDRYQGNVSESAPVGTPVLQVSASDDDGASDVVTYIITDGNDGNAFTINSTSGEISTAAMLDRENRGQFILTVTAEDSDPLSPRLSKVVVIVDILDVSEHPPSFLMPNYTVNVFENAEIGSSVLTVETSDLDQSESTLTYSVIGGDGKFGVTSEGVVFVNGSLDYETVTNYTFQVVAEESPPNSHLRANVTVFVTILDVNEFNPQFNQSIYNAQVRENEAMGTSVITVSARDDDGDSNLISYTIIAGNEDRNFTMNNKTGEIIIARPLDRETSSQFVLTVQAEDNGDPTRTSEVSVLIGIIDANDHGPVFTKSYYNGTISELASTSTTVLVIQALDQDVSKAELEYQIDVEDKFRTETHYGLGFVVVDKMLDYEQERSYSFEVYAVEKSPEKRNTSVVVNITILDANDNRPVFENSSYTSTVMEGEAIGTNVVNVTASDADSDIFGPVHYEIIEGNPLGNFTIDVNTGVLNTATTLDHEVQQKFVLVIEAKDGGSPSLSETASVTIHVLNHNEVGPVFLGLPYTATVQENAPSDTAVLTVQAIDMDKGQSGDFVYSLVGDDGLFSITQEGKIGYIKVAGLFDYEMNKTVEFYVVAKETGTTEKLETNASVLVTITDLNDNPPVFGMSLYEMSVGELSAPPVSVGTVKATDKDSGVFGQVSYSILHGDMGGNFTINNKTGQIFTGATLNREVLDKYVLTVEATDGGSPPRTAVTNVDITVTDQNELPPLFHDTPYEESLEENVEYSNYLVLKVRATDPDLMSIEYQLSSSAMFTIDKTTGLIEATGTFDREAKAMYNLTVTAIDHGGLNTSQQVLIHITDANDNTPQFQNTPYDTSVPDNTTIGVVIVTVSATDQDDAHNGDIIYSLLGAEGKFAINQSNGEISVAGKLDTQLKASYSLQVLATDRGIPQARVNSTMVRVNVTDYSNEAPKFASVAYVGEINEELSGEFVLNVVASDPDHGMFGELTYSITKGNTYGAFQINASGDIVSSMALDYENTTQRSFDLVVTVTDGGGLADTTQVRITVTDVNDNAPTLVNIPSPAEVNISDQIPADTLLFALQAQDLDSGNNKEVEYLFSPSSNLSVNQNTGVIQAKTLLQHSVAPSISFSVHVQDKGNPSMSSGIYNLTFNLIPSPLPSPFLLPSLTERTVYENISVNDVILVMNSSTTADSFSILLEFPTEGNFKIDNNGSLTLAKLLDREKVSDYSLLIKAMKDGQQALGYVSITVRDVNDAGPQFLFDVYKGQVREDAVVGDDVLQVQAVDEDHEGTISYSITSGNAEAIFDISSSGEIKIATKPDYETTAFFNLTVTASDGLRSSSSFVEITIIDVNDNTPRFLNSSFSVEVSEDTPGGSFVLQITAVDNDDGDILFYSITGDDGKFVIDTITGVISTTSELLDYETRKSYSLNITATDNGGLMTSVLVLVNLADANDNKPTFEKLSYNVTINENFVGSLSVNLNATDGDAGVSGTLTYSIVGSSDFFAVNPATGAINATVPVDVEDDAFTVDENCRGVTVLTVQAKDGGTPALDVTTTVAIFVTDFNDNKPVFSKSSYEEVIAEFHTGSVLQVQARDEDCGVNGDIQYSFTSDNASALFHINETTGNITVTKNLNESLGSYFLNVTASNDLASPRLQSNVMVEITVIQNRNYAPEFDRNNYMFSVFENASIGSLVGSVSASDVNKDKEGIIIYSIDNPGYVIPFDIDPESGTITLVRNIDREHLANYTLIVTVKDFGDIPLTDTTTVFIMVDDVNDAIPIFPDNAVNSYAVPEDYAVGSVIGVVTATDADANKFGEPIYVLFSGDDGGHFHINRSTGEIRLIKSLDRETIHVFNLVIRAYNYGSYNTSRRRRDLGVTYSEIQIRINITDVNDNDPRFLQLDYIAGFKESSEAGTAVTTVLAFDPDDGDNGKVSYSIVSGDGDESFTIDASTGLISTTAEAAQLTTLTTTLKITAKDSPAVGSPRSVPESATVTIYKLPTNPLTMIVSSDTDRETLIEIIKNITGPGYDVIIDTITPQGATSNVTFYVVQKDGDVFLTEGAWINLVVEYCKENEDICNQFGISIGTQSPSNAALYLGEDDVTVLEAVAITLGVLVGIVGMGAILLLCCLRRRTRYMPVYEPSTFIPPNKAVSFDEKPHYFLQPDRAMETQEVEIHMGSEVDSADEVNDSSTSSSEGEKTEAIAKVHAYMNHALMNDNESTDSDSSDDNHRPFPMAPERDGRLSSASTDPIVDSYNITRL